MEEDIPLLLSLPEDLTVLVVGKVDTGKGALRLTCPVLHRIVDACTTELRCCGQALAWGEPQELDSILEAELPALCTNIKVLSCTKSCLVSLVGVYPALLHLVCSTTQTADLGPISVCTGLLTRMRLRQGG